MYNIKIHYMQVTEPCSVYIPRKIEIRRSYMRSNRLYMYPFVYFTFIQWDHKKRDHYVFYEYVDTRISSLSNIKSKRLDNDI